MVGLQEIRSSNSALRAQLQDDTLNAVFVGATSGIGFATLKSFAKQILRPRIVIVGRSEKNFSAKLDELRSLNNQAAISFLETDVSLLKNIDAISATIRQTIKHVDLLYLAQGYISFNGREDNADGLDNSFSLRYYGRVRFAQNLLPILTPNARVISVLAGGKEGKILEDDLDLEKHYSLGQAAGQFATMHTLTWDHLAGLPENKDRSFIHVFPGLVQTDLLAKSATGLLRLFIVWVATPLLRLFAQTPEESGERMLYYGTAPQYARGSWSLDWDGTPKSEKVLLEYRDRGFADKVWEHNMKIFERVAAH